MTNRQIDSLADKLDAWHTQDIENAEAFVRCIVGLLRMKPAKWDAQR